MNEHTYTLNVIQSNRGEGKTYQIMTEINELVVQQRRQDVMVVFPDVRYAYWWISAWRNRFGSTPPPDYITVQNRLKLRGRRLAKVYVEDVDTLESGIYDDLFAEIEPSMWSAHGDVEVVVTSSPIALNNRTHSRITTSADIKSEFLLRLRSTDNPAY